MIDASVLRRYVVFFCSHYWIIRRLHPLLHYNYLARRPNRGHIGGGRWTVPAFEVVCMYLVVFCCASSLCPGSYSVVSFFFIVGGLASHEQSGKPRREFVVRAWVMSNACGSCECNVHAVTRFFKVLRCVFCLRAEKFAGPPFVYVDVVNPTWKMHSRNTKYSGVTTWCPFEGIAAVIANS